MTCMRILRWPALRRMKRNAKRGAEARFEKLWDPGRIKVKPIKSRDSHMHSLRVRLQSMHGDLL